MITVSIVVHKSPVSQLSRALECLSKSSVNKIYVVENSPTASLKETSCKFEKVEYIKVPNNGFGAGHNVAIELASKAGSKYHLVMNADIWWEGDIIRELVDFLDNNKEVGLVSPKTFYPNGNLQYTCRLLPTPGDMFIRGFLPKKLCEKRMSNYLLVKFNHEAPLNCPYLLGSFMFFRMEALNKEGRFDERFFMYPEDIDITRRLHISWKTIYWPKVSIIHEHQQASKKNLKMFWIHFCNMIKYFNKWGWIIDRQRKQFNRNLLHSVKKHVL